MAITLTEKAAKHVNRNLRETRQRLSACALGAGAGCSGLAYRLELLDEPAAEDQVFESNGVKVFVRPKKLGLPSMERNWILCARV
jgi:iron-sulfur cluster assembly protein